MYPPTKHASPFGMERTPFDPQSGSQPPLMDMRLIRRFKLYSVLDDYLKCTDEHENFVYVAKPLILRKTPFDGQTVQGVTFEYQSPPDVRKATDELEQEETQSVFPLYAPGVDTIVAVRFRDGIWSPVPVVVEGETPDTTETQLMTDENGRKIEWQDVNEAGRGWRKVDYKVAVSTDDLVPDVLRLTADEEADPPNSRQHKLIGDNEADAEDGPADNGHIEVAIVNAGGNEQAKIKLVPPPNRGTGAEVHCYYNISSCITLPAFDTEGVCIGFWSYVWEYTSYVWKWFSPWGHAKPTTTPTEPAWA